MIYTLSFTMLLIKCINKMKMKMKMLNKQKYLNYIKNAIECENNDIDTNTINNKINNLSNIIDKIDNDLNEINADTIIYKNTFIDFINSIKDENDMIDLIDVYNFLKNCINENIEKLCVYEHQF